MRCIGFTLSGEILFKWLEWPCSVFNNLIHQIAGRLLESLSPFPPKYSRKNRNLSPQMTFSSHFLREGNSFFNVILAIFIGQFSYGHRLLLFFAIASVDDQKHLSLQVTASQAIFDYHIFSIKRRTPNKRRVQINAGYTGPILKQTHPAFFRGPGFYSKRVYLIRIMCRNCIIQVLFLLSYLYLWPYSVSYLHNAFAVEQLPIYFLRVSRRNVTLRRVQ